MVSQKSDYTLVNKLSDGTYYIGLHWNWIDDRTCRRREFIWDYNWGECYNWRDEKEPRCIWKLPCPVRIARDAGTVWICRIFIFASGTALTACITWTQASAVFRRKPGFWACLSTLCNLSGTSRSNWNCGNRCRIRILWKYIDSSRFSGIVGYCLIGGSFPD